MIRKTAQALLTLCLIPLLIGASLLLMLLPPVTMFWAERLADFENSAVSRVELMQAAEAGLIYVSGGSDYMPRGNDFRTAFPADVISHMDDVRDVFYAVRIAVATLAAAVAMLIFFLITRNEQVRAGKALSWSASLTTVCTLALVVYGLLSFDELFSKMHQLLFADGTWLFQSNSLLITAYPFEFWIAMAATWAAVLFIMCLLAFAFGQNLKMHAIRRKNNTKPKV
jgi:integral membrane protein (TIGR01906 family)